ncbi:hypothetical protein BASA81_009060 [Batrachochytrium salamandrivorans]|nr:hypothetical protein BASA81_009060 [Batrachochytrium salamandrivorans]
MESEYEVVLVGTNLVLSILGAALARAGRKVLCLDDADSYGGEFGTLTLKEMQDFMARAPLPATCVGAGQFSGSSNAYFPLGPAEYGEASDDASLDLAQYRTSEFGFDLTSRVVFSRGLAVDVLAESGVARYLEFQICDGCFFLPNLPGSSPQPVPHSKNQVFTSSELSMLEKRQLMRFLQFASDFANNHDAWINDKWGAANPGRSLIRPQNKSSDEDLSTLVTDDITLLEFLIQSMRVSSPKLQEIIQYSVAEGQTGCLSGMRKVSRYLRAMGRFGHTPFLHPTYGISELCQAFSRMCSVYGGTCALRTKPISLTMGKGLDLVLENGTTVKATCCIVAQASYFNPTTNGQDEKLFSGWIHHEYDVRMVCIVKQTKLGVGKAFLVIPPSIHAAVNQQHAVFVIQQDYTTRVVPQGLLMIHLSVQCTITTAAAAQEEGLEIWSSSG